jgi:hypothetical protein
VRTLINVPALRPFEDLTWDEVPAVFQNAPQLSFRQAWQENLSPDFREGTVRVGWNAAGFWVLASLTDDHIVSRATAANQPLWTLGDVFEIFVRDLAGEEYLELHTDPKGYWMQLRFASDRVFALLKARQIRVEDLLVDEPLFHTRTREREGGWDVLACVTAVHGRNLRASFGRYDYGPGGEPVLSSTSTHREVNYHDQSAWMDFRLVE